MKDSRRHPATFIWFYTLILVTSIACGDNPEAPAETDTEVTGLTTEPVPGTDFEKATRSTDSVIEEGGYLLNGKKTGAWMTYANDGRIKTLEHYIDGKLNGVVLNFSSRGQIEEKSHYQNGVPHGYYAKYRFGRPQEEMTYVNGKLDGTVKKYYTNGKLREEIGYKNGLQHGSYKYYNEDGSVSLDYTYENGKKVSGGIVE